MIYNLYAFIGVLIFPLDVSLSFFLSFSISVFSFFAGASRGKMSLPNCPPMYIDLVYIPNHSSAKNVDAEFFNRVRSSYYVVSGNDLTAQEPSRAVLDALLEGKAQWDTNMQVSSVAFKACTFSSSGFSFLTISHSLRSL